MTDELQKKNIPIPVIAFVTAELLLYLLFMGMDIAMSNSHLSADNIFYRISRIGALNPSLIKYYSILLCFAFSLYLSIKKHELSKRILAAAMCFTIISDFFLLLHPEHLIPGLFTFCAAQSIYLFAISGGDKKKTLITIALRLFLALTASVIILLSGLIRFDNDTNMNAVLFLVLLYAISFMGNIIRQIIIRRCIFKHQAMFLTGLLLFVLCDINVLIYNLNGFLNISSQAYFTLRNISSVLMWGFYLPSQVIIVLSA